jgi:hypothetical protein
MRMSAKVTLYALIVAGGFFGAIALTTSLGRTADEAGMAGLLWAAICGLAGMSWLRCPHCRLPALITATGWAIPFVGARCRRCGEKW